MVTSTVAVTLLGYNAALRLRGLPLHAQSIPIGTYAEPSFLYSYCAYTHLLLCAMQVGMMATSNTRALLLPLLRLAQVLLATYYCSVSWHHMMHDGTTASLSLASEQPVPSASI